MSGIRRNRCAGSRSSHTAPRTPGLTSHPQAWSTRLRFGETRMPPTPGLILMVHASGVVAYGPVKLWPVLGPAITSHRMGPLKKTICGALQVIRTTCPG